MAKTRFQGAADIEDEDFKRAFVEDALVIDCHEIRLVQKRLDSPITYVGPGSIEVGAGKGVVVRMVCPRSETDPYAPIKFLTSLNGPQAGVILADEHYYRLEARDVAGDTWLCESGSLERSDRESTVVLSFTSSRITCATQAPASKDYAFLVFLDELEFPRNTVRTTTVEKGGEPWGTQSKWDLSEGVVAGLNISYEGINVVPDRKYSQFVAVAGSEVETPAGFEDRLLEAIRFCTATMATPVMTQVGKDGKRTIELSRARDLNKGLVEPPVPHQNHGPDFFRLFDCYYAVRADPNLSHRADPILSQGW